jgi:hypothetical protein
MPDVTEHDFTHTYVCTRTSTSHIGCATGYNEGYMRPALALWVCAGALWAQNDYTGPRPPKPDTPYLMAADTLIPTEAAQAREEQKKDESIYTIPGATSTARTPLAEPVFLFESQKITPDTIGLFRLEVKDGQRHVILSQKRRSRPLRLTFKRLADRLYRLEVNENMGLENGEYALSPSGSNDSFCFTVY